MIASSNIHRARILIVDDQAASISLLKLILSGSGFTSIASTTDSREVCDLHRKHRYDLILLDLLMPGMDGFQVMEGLKEIEIDGYLPVLVEPQWVTDTRLPKRWFISTNLGAMFGDHKLAGTFYGVASGEATPTRASYTAKPGLIALRAGLFASHTLTPDVRLFGILRLESLAGAANRDSPLVRRKGGWSAGIGLAWALARSERSAIN